MRAGDVPVLPRGVRRHFDRVRNRQVLLGPERVLVLDEIGVAVLDRVDGVASVEAITAALAGIYDAPRERIGADVTAYLDGLANKRLLDIRGGGDTPTENAHG